MGQINTIKSYGRRSIIMSSARSWKQENLSWISIVGLSTMAAVIMFLFMLYGTSNKEITLIVNGEESTVTTRQWKLERLLEEQQIVFDIHDRISIPAHSKLEHGDTIEIQQTHTLAIIVEGQQNVVHTIGDTVAEVMSDLHITLNTYDRTIPDLQQPVKAGDSIRIIRVEKAFGDIEKQLPFNVVKKNDTKLAKGKEALVTEGQKGILIESVEYTFEDGILTNERVVNSTLAAASVDKVIAVGTKSPVTVLSASSPSIQEVTKKGVTFAVKQILTDVQLTAYDAGIESTGKTADHPQYGITFSGTKVEEGRTIAVDPKVIPMGWWVYIEGYGFRRAEDKGSAVKGKHIDIYFDDNAYANKFGRKRGATVYIVGPSKPEAN